MNRQLRSAPRLVAIALLVGIAVVACGKPNDATGGQPASSSPVAQQSQADQAAATLAPTPSDTATNSAAAASPPPAATADPLDTQLSNLDTLLNGVNGSLSASDASGGE